VGQGRAATGAAAGPRRRDQSRPGEGRGSPPATLTRARLRGYGSLLRFEHSLIPATCLLNGCCTNHSGCCCVRVVICMHQRFPVVKVAGGAWRRHGRDRDRASRFPGSVTPSAAAGLIEMAVASTWRGAGVVGTGDARRPGGQACPDQDLARRPPVHASNGLPRLLDFGLRLDLALVICLNVVG